jgi:hypothetical protein
LPCDVPKGRLGPEEWKDSIIVPIYKEADKTECSNYSGVSLLLSTNKILTKSLVSRLTPYREEIIDKNLSDMFPIRNG